jgi:glyoxylase I family protein
VQVSRLDHINIGGPPALIDECRRFYVDVIGLSEGHRPPFRSRGFWLFAGDTAVVHLTESSIDRGTQKEGPFAHYAFVCTGLDDAIERLKSAGIEYTVDEVPLTDQVQLFLHDPAGIALELNFSRNAPLSSRA